MDASDPLAVLSHGKSASAPREAPGRVDVYNAVLAPIQGTIVSVSVVAGDAVRFGQPLLVMEAMKMEHVIESTMSGVVQAVTVAIGDTVFEDHPLVVVDSDGTERAASDEAEAVDLDGDPARPRRGTRTPGEDPRRSASRRRGAPGRDAPAHRA